MKALSLTQPWATLVAIGAKKIETRSWYTPYRQITNMSDTSRNQGGAERLIKAQFFAVAREPSRGVNGERPALGRVLAVCDLVLCTCTELVRADLQPNERAFGNYDDRRYAFLLDNVRAISPREAKGALGLWEWS